MITRAAHGSNTTGTVATNEFNTSNVKNVSVVSLAIVNKINVGIFNNGIVATSEMTLRISIVNNKPINTNGIPNSGTAEIALFNQLNGFTQLVNIPTNVAIVIGIVM